MAKRHIAQTIFAPVLWPLSKLYALAMRARSSMYDTGLLSSAGLQAFTVSIGNLSWGGTGKSPLVDALLAFADAAGIRAAVLTRGYGAAVSGTVQACSDGSFADPAGTGEKPEIKGTADEPLMLAAAHPNAVVLIDPKRKRAAELLFKESLFPAPPDLVLLDDGFQHRAIRRDLDLVLLDKDDFAPSRFFSPKTNWDRVLPLGTWREGISAAERADAFLVKCPHSEWNALRELARARLAPLQKDKCRPLFAFELRPVGLRNILTNILHDGSSFSAEPYSLLCGVGNPEQVQDTAAAMLGHRPVRCLTFRDHSGFSGYEDEIERIAAESVLVCTAKDAVKLGGRAQNAACRRSHSSSPLAGIYCLETVFHAYDALFDHSTEGWRKWWEAQWMTGRKHVLKAPAADLSKAV